MTRKEVIDTLKLAKAEVDRNYPMNYYLAIDQAIKYIQAYETIENKLKEIESMKTNVIVEEPLFILTSDFNDMRGNSGETVKVYASDLKKAKVGDDFAATYTNGCGRGNVCESIEIIYKTDSGCAVLHRVWGTTDEDTPKDWEEEPQLIWVELN